ncbi:MAG: sugar porter family MFS transporter, partial [Gammaproteobacteria bacterium]|nr:sugar porter family MFS transporter [Gammaproteobacteria bacterium]
MTNKLIYTGYVSVVVALGGFLLGFDFSVIAGVLPFIEGYFNLDAARLGFAAANVSYGAVLGTIAAGPMIHRVGRKKVLVTCAILYAASAVMSAVATDLTFFNISRIIGGLAIGASIITAPVYVAEVAPPQYRGRLVGLNQFTIVLGISVAYSSNYFLLDIGENNWRWMLGVEAIPAVLYFLLLLRVPESPRWLVMQGREVAARGVIEQLVDRAQASSLLEDIRASLAGGPHQARYRELFKGKLARVVAIAIVLGLCQQMSGVNAVFSYAPMIFEQAGAATSAAFISAAVVGVVNLLATVIAIWSMDRWGRRPLLITGATGMTLAHVVLAGSALAGHFEGYLVLAAIMLFIASFALSVGPGYWILISEILPNWARGIAISVIQAITSMASIVVVQLFPWQVSTVGIAGTFGIYAL